MLGSLILKVRPAQRVGIQMAEWCQRVDRFRYRDPSDPCYAMVTKSAVCGLPMVPLRRLWWRGWACPTHDPHKRCPAYWRIIARGLYDLVHPRAACGGDS